MHKEIPNTLCQVSKSYNLPLYSLLIYVFPENKVFHFNNSATVVMFALIQHFNLSI